LPLPEALPAADPANGAADDAPEVAARQAFLPREDFFMAAAVLAAQQSRDPNTQVGACLVDREGRLVSLGYNCLPPNCDAQEFPWNRSADRPGEPLKTKDLYVCHAELSAMIDKRAADVAGGTIYATLSPRSHCAGLARLKKVVFLSDKYHDRPKYEASRRVRGSQADIRAHRAQHGRRSTLA
jgi:dCMP deaminase